MANRIPERTEFDENVDASVRAFIGATYVRQTKFVRKNAAIARFEPSDYE